MPFKTLATNLVTIASAVLGVIWACGMWLTAGFHLGVFGMCSEGLDWLRLSILAVFAAGIPLTGFFTGRFGRKAFRWIFQIETTPAR